MPPKCSENAVIMTEDGRFCDGLKDLITDTELTDVKAVDQDGNPVEVDETFDVLLKEESITCHFKPPTIYESTIISEEDV